MNTHSPSFFFVLTFCFNSLLSKVELSSIKKELLQGFSPDDSFPLGVPLFMETPRPCSPLAQIDFPEFDEVQFHLFVSLYSCLAF